MLDKIIGTEIFVAHFLTDDEIQDLIAREEITSLATEKFIKGVISFSDFLDYLEVAGVSIDNFLVTADENAMALGF